MEIGLDTNRMVHVISGLEPGEIVKLAPPLAPAEAQDVKARKALGQRNEAGPVGSGGVGDDKGKQPERSRPGPPKPVDPRGN